MPRGFGAGRERRLRARTLKREKTQMRKLFHTHKNPTGTRVREIAIARKLKTISYEITRWLSIAYSLIRLFPFFWARAFSGSRENLRAYTEAKRRGFASDPRISKPDWNGFFSFAL